MAQKVVKWCSIIGTFSFFILSTIAMFFFAGGNSIDSNAEGYSFVYNFFSDLGMWTSYSGEPNYIASILFGTGLTLVGVLLIPYFIYIPIFTTNNKKSTMWLIFGSFLGIIASIAYIGIGFTPWDIRLPAHMWFVYIAFPISLPMAICYIIGLSIIPDVPKRVIIFFLIYLVILFAYLYLLFFGPATATPTGRMIQVVGQKIIVYTTLITMLFEGISVQHLPTKN